MAYRDMTFCKAEECKNFKDCSRSFNQDVKDDIENIQNKTGKPVYISFIMNPSELNCYKK